MIGRQGPGHEKPSVPAKANELKVGWLQSRVTGQDCRGDLTSAAGVAERTHIVAPTIVLIEREKPGTLVLPGH